MRYPELFRAYCQALQAVITAGADVHLLLGDRSCGVIEVQECGEGLLVCFITSDSPTEQRVMVSPSTSLTVAFAAF